MVRVNAVRAVRSIVAVMAVSIAAGCDESDGSDGDQERLYPGPCTAATHPEDGAIDTECLFGYDAGGRLTDIDCARLDETESWHITRVFAGDELTEVSRELVEEPGAAGDTGEEEIWTLGEETVTRTLERVTGTLRIEIVETYEGEGFQFLGHSHDLERRLEAPDSLLRHVSTTTRLDDPEQVTTAEVDSTYDGPPREGTRTRTDSDGTAIAFHYDAGGRLRQYATSGGDVTNERTYVYEEDRLTEIRFRSTIEGGSDDAGAEFEYDSHGNLIVKRRAYVEPPLVITDYGYDCWEE